jgi:hypothetical protein
MELGCVTTPSIKPYQLTASIFKMMKRPIELDLEIPGCQIESQTNDLAGFELVKHHRHQSIIHKVP